MNWFDLAMAGMVAVLVLSGIRKGISHSGLGLIAVIVAFLAAAWLFPTYRFGFIAVFVGLICAAGACAHFFGRWLQNAGQGWLDRILGGAFGLLNALLFSVMLVVAVMAFAPQREREVVANSDFGPAALEAAQAVVEFVPDEMKVQIERSYAELERALPARYQKDIPPLPRNEI